MHKYTFITMLFLFAHVVSAQTTPQADEAQISAARTASNAAIANHDVAGIIQNILPDFIIVTGRGKRVAGRDTVAAFWKQTFAQMPGVVYVRTPLQVTISKNDTLAWETGKWANAYFEVL